MDPAANHLQNVLAALRENYGEQELQKRIVLGNNYPGVPKHIPEGGIMDTEQKNHSGYQPSASAQKPKNPPKAPYGKKDVKWCPQCEDYRPTTEFGNKKNSPDGLNTWCKPCTNKKAKEYAAKRNKKSKAGADPTDPRKQPPYPFEKCSEEPEKKKNNRLVIPVDLTDLDWIYNELELVAKRDERTMAAQIRYYLKQISRGNLVWDRPAAAEMVHD